MLVLTRDPGQAIIMGTKPGVAEITLTILGVTDSKITIHATCQSKPFSTYRVGEEVYLTPEILVRFLGGKRHQARLGFQAPPSMIIHREEIHNRIVSELQRGVPA